MKTVAEFISKLSYNYKELWLNGEKTNIETMSMHELRSIVERDCVKIQFSEYGREICPYCAWLSCPDNPRHNNRPGFWLELTSLEKYIVKAIFKNS